LKDEHGKVIKKGTDVHAAVVSGDTIGDPFKDTSGPSLNILMKLMTMISLVFAKDQFQGLEPYDKWWIALIIGIVFMIIAVGLTRWMRKEGFGKLQFDFDSVQDVEKQEVNEMTSSKGTVSRGEHL